MGRTVIPMRYEVDAQMDELRRYITSLRKEDREPFDRLAVGVRKHYSSITYANPLNPQELMQWSAMLELEKKIERLKSAIDRHLRV